MPLPGPRTVCQHCLQCKQASPKMRSGQSEMSVMASVTIRNLPDEARARLRERAARAGRSMEAEMRKILVDASLSDDRAASSEGLREWVDRLYKGRKPGGVVDDLIAERRRQANRE